MNSLTLLTSDLISQEIPLFKLWGLSDSTIAKILNLTHDPETINGLHHFIDSHNLWSSIDGLVFCLVPFQDIHDTLYLNTSVPRAADSDPLGIDAMFSILADGTPVMFLDKNTFSPTVFRHEMIHFTQFKQGRITRRGYQFFWDETQEIPSFFSQTRSLYEQSLMEWEFEAYSWMYSDADLKIQHDACVSSIMDGINSDIVNRMKEYYELFIIPSGRVLPFDVEIF